MPIIDKSAKQQPMQGQGGQAVQGQSSGATPPNPLGANPQNQPKQSNKSDDNDVDPSELAAIADWQGKITKARSKRKNTFDRMRKNMNFAGGLQWPGQKDMNDSRVVVNFTNRNVQSKTAQLYAKNPTVVFERRPRLDFQLFDGKLENLIPIVMAASTTGLDSLPPNAQALLADFSHGLMVRNMIDRVGKTMEIVLQYFMDEVDDDNYDFMTQAKQAVRQAVVTGVAYCEPRFVRDMDVVLTQSGLGDTTVNRTKQAKLLLDKMEKGDIQETSPQYQQLKNLFMSLASDVQDQLQSPDINERLIFDFKPSTSIIPDTKCKSLKGFIGADWIVEEFFLDNSIVKAIFEISGEFSPQKRPDTKSGDEKETNWIANPNVIGKGKEQKCYLWRVLNKRDHTEFYMVDGYKKFVQKPQVLEPKVRGFWPIQTLTFNDVVVEEGTDIDCFPPSDVQLSRDAQKEWNRTRNELRKHRKANSPGWITQKGVLTTADKDNLTDAPTNGVTELEGVPLGADLNKIFQPRPQMPIEPLVYDTGTMQMDVSVVGAGGAEMSAPQQIRGKKGETATQATLMEQKEMSVTQSNVEDLDAFLSGIMRIAGELWMLEAQKETTIRIAGPGAVVPEMEQNREDFINQILLKTKAASSGRPNQAVAIRNWQILGPMLQQLGANPQALVRETVQRLGDNLDPEQFFPLQAPQPQAQQQPQGGKHQPSQQGEHEQGRTAPPQQGRPGPSQAPQTPQRQAAMQQN